MNTRTALIRLARCRGTWIVFATVGAYTLTLIAPDVAFVPTSVYADARWLPAGAGLALLLLAGTGAWPALFAGVLAANIASGADTSVALSLACAATAESYVGAYIVHAYAGGMLAMERTRTFVSLIAGSVVASAAGPVVARVLLDLVGHPSALTSNASLMRWWIADGMSTLVLVPAVLAWQPTRVCVPARRAEEHVVTVVALLATWFVSFGGQLPVELAHAPLEVVCVPALLWTAFRFGLRPASLAVAALSLVALRGTLGGAGPFALTGHSAYMVALEAFVGVTAATTFALAILTGERRLAEAELQRAAKTDALTGVANYGRLTEVLASETARALRTGREFALLFVDLDGLKRINDTLGHLAGNNAIQRVATALRSCCREIDTVARIGGDEFCVLFPDSDENAAWNAAGRVARMLYATPASQRVTVSAGVAVYPRDGATPDSVLAAADAVLYKSKAATHAAQRERAPR